MECGPNSALLSLLQDPSYDSAWCLHFRKTLDNLHDLLEDQLEKSHQSEGQFGVLNSKGLGYLMAVCGVSGARLP